MPEWRQRVQEMRLVKPGDLADHPYQHRLHSPEQRAHLVGILDEIGIAGGLLAWPSQRNGGALTAIDGHLRKSLDAEVPWPTLITDLNDQEADILLLAYDWIGAQAQSGKDELQRLLGQVQPQTDAVLALQAQIAEQAGLPWGPGATAPEEAPEPQIDRAAELQKQWGTCLGQLWEIGPHRVICGDCTDMDVIRMLLRAHRPDAVVTDPPYGVGVDYGAFEDTPAHVSALIQGFMPSLQRLGCPIALTPGVPAMWSYPRPTWLLMWVHPAPSGSCPWGFAGVNPILVYGNDPYLQAGRGRRPDSISMAADRQDVIGHPTPKPLKVWSWLVERLTIDRGALCYDPFLGSGTTLVSCEQLGRIGYGCEIDPGYVAVCLERMQGLGLTPRLLEAAAHA